MKLNQLFAASVFTVLSSHWAAAQTTIRIVASNGDRTATQTAISKLLAPGWTFRGVDGSATSTNLSVATGANFGAWNGTYAGNAVVIKTSYAGALAGIAAVAGNTQQRGAKSVEWNRGGDRLRTRDRILRLLDELPEHLAIQR